MNYLTFFSRLVIALLFVALFPACSSDDDEPVLDIVQLGDADFGHVSWDESHLSMRIVTDQDWTLTSMVPWIKTSAVRGTGITEVTLDVPVNLNKERTGDLIVRTADATQMTISITQEAYPVGQEYAYKLPVIFHVLYENYGDQRQYIDHKVLAQIIENVNRLYAGDALFGHLGELGPDINLKFVLPETRPDGTRLDYPGVEYIPVQSLPWECDKFMNGNATGQNSARDNINMLWDGNEYINVFIYPFKTQGNYMTLGISHFPYSIAGDGHELAGLSAVPRPITNADLQYPHCVCINADIIYKTRSSSTTINISAADATVAHELGHYLGLYHAFNEGRDPNADSDYCSDTHPYDRNKYSTYEFMQYARQYGGTTNIPLNVGSKRTDSRSGETFMSFNIMDYEVSYTDRFSLEQRNRMRHVLTYSTFIPGPKQGAAATRTASEEPVILPMRYIE